MTQRLFWIAFAIGLAAIVWIGAGYVGTHALALAMTVAIAAAFLSGAWELHQYRADSAALALALAQPAGGTLEGWLAAVPAGLRTPVRLRIESGRGALPGPAMTPYLVGLLVMLGMLGTFLGMVVTFRGAVFALEGSTDLQTIRAALAEPIRGLGLSFGTSVAGVAASAMLGLMSTLCRRERLAVARLLEGSVATVLRVYSPAHQQQEALRTAQAQVDALQAQAGTLPQIVDRLDTLMQRIEQRSAQLDERMLASQAAFQREAATAYTTLAHDVGVALHDSLASGARAAGESIRPVMESTMAQIARDQAQHEAQRLQAWSAQLQALATGLGTQWGQTAERMDGLAGNATARMETLAQQMAASVDKLTQVTAGRLEAASQQASQQVQALALQVHGDTARLAEQTHTSVTALAEQTAASLAALGEQVRAAAATAAGQTHDSASALGERLAATVTTLAGQVTADVGTLAARMDSSMNVLAATWQTQMEALRTDEQRRGEAAVARLGELQAAVAQHLATLGNALEAPLARLLQTASEVPQAAAGVLVQLRQEMAHLSGQENAALTERTALVERLSALMLTVEEAARQAAQMATLAQANAVELSSWGEAFGQGVELFHAGNEKLAAALQQVESAITRSTARSDEQLAYYVAQAREVIDLSISAQHGVLERLRTLGAPAPGTTREAEPA